MGKQNKDSKIIVRINDDFKNKYKKLCESLGYTYSKRIVMIIEKDFDLLTKIQKQQGDD